MSNTSIIWILSIALFIVVVILIYLIYISLRRSSFWPKRKHVAHLLCRHESNPVISPLPFREWELAGTFNPAAIKDDEGNVHLLYRALGADGLSRVGHAVSKDGINFDDRAQYPVFEPGPENGIPDKDKMTGPREFNPSYYTSGGGWGGCEDPRAVKIDGRVYMMYVAFEGWESVRIALTSICEQDLKKRRWNWRRPAFMSSPTEVNKNWVMFPEKINGKYAIIHSISPEILIEYVDSLDQFYAKKYIKSRPPKGGRKEYWDNWVRGAGPPPIRTSRGWLLLYHAMDRNDPNKYKLGAMLLDLNNPKKILYRSPTPILSPERHYENDWKPGVVYASGAVTIGKNLMVYYGGGDKHVCIAETPLEGLVDWLIEHGEHK